MIEAIQATAGRRFVLYAVTLSIPLVMAILAVAGYFGIKKLTASLDYCGSYGEFDDELGWRLRPNASSCLSLRNHLTGAVYFDTRIHTNSGGFRDVAPGGAVPTNAIMAIGDSWTFGYGVNQEESFPHWLSEALGVPVVNAGIPGYSAGSNLLLLSRTVPKYRPAIVIYYTTGMYVRSMCNADEAEVTLLPCYAYHSDRDEAVLIVPKPGAVSAAVRNDIYPGGALTAGYDSLWRYTLRFKIPEVSGQVLNALGGLVGLGAKPLRRHPRHEMRALELEMRQHAALASQYGFGFILIDPMDYYADAFAGAAAGFAHGAIRIGMRKWKLQVEAESEQLPAAEARVPMDGHFGRGTNRLIGNYLAAVIRERLPAELQKIGN